MRFVSTSLKTATCFEATSIPSNVIALSGIGIYIGHLTKYLIGELHSQRLAYSLKYSAVLLLTAVLRTEYSLGLEFGDGREICTTIYDRARY